MKVNCDAEGVECQALINEHPLLSRMVKHSCSLSRMYRL